VTDHVNIGGARVYRLITPIALLFLIAVLFITAATAVALQHPPDGAKVRMENDSKRETQLRSDGSHPADAVDPKRLKAVMDQIEEDFKRILMLHNELGKAAAAADSLNYGFISDATAEIKKRASRLRTTLALDKAEDSNQVPQNRRKFSDAEVRAALVELCKEIESFVKNPVIESPGTVDQLQTARANRDLEGVIDLSGRIKKTAEKLSRVSK
jgi:hypothetical protein